jgi:hypothetical protein
VCPVVARAAVLGWGDRSAGGDSVLLVVSSLGSCVCEFVAKLLQSPGINRCRSIPNNAAISVEWRAGTDGQRPELGKPAR